MLAEAEALEHLRLATSVAGLDVEELVLPAEHDIVVDGMRLHYLDWGCKGPPLLFLHGGCLTAHSWDLVCLALHHESHCIALDQRGHGDSEWSPTLDYGPEAHVRDIRGLVAKVALTMPVLVGQSMGGLNAVTYAAQAPNELAGLVLVDVGTNIHWEGAQRIRDFVIDDPGPGPLEDFVARAQAFNPRRDPRLLRLSLRHNLRRLPDGRLAWKYDRRPLTPERFAAVKERLEELQVEAITCPVLVIRGAESDVFSAAQAAEFAATFPDGRWATVEDAGHTAQGDNPRELARILRAFLEEIGYGQDQPGERNPVR